MASVAAILGAAGIGAAANSADTFFNWGINRNLNQQQQEMALQRQREEQAFNALEAQKQRDFESTAYQRTIADMEAAGINPASIMGSMNLDSGGSAARSSASGVAGSNFHGSNIGAGVSNIMSSAINGLIAKDRDAAKYLADEFRDNAKHAYRMEEINEKVSEIHESKKLMSAMKHHFDMNLLRAKSKY